MNDYTVAVGMVSCFLAILGLPLMWSRNPSHMLSGALLATPFTLFMFVLTFFVGR